MVSDQSDALQGDAGQHLRSLQTHHSLGDALLGRLQDPVSLL